MNSLQVSPELACIRADEDRQRRRDEDSVMRDVFARVEAGMACAFKGLGPELRERVAVALLERVANHVAELKGGEKAQACLGRVASRHGQAMAPPRRGMRLAAERLFVAQRGRG